MIPPTKNGIGIMAQPEQQAREEIDRLLTSAGWRVSGLGEANIHASRGVALREFPLDSGYGFADYLLYIDGKAAGVIEAKKAGSTLIGVESQSSRYGSGLHLISSDAAAFVPLRGTAWGDIDVIDAKTGALVP
jgi:type I site-specific restriction endonuclease